MSKPTPEEKQGPMSKLGVVKAMQAAAFAKDWALFKSYFADQVYYRVGNVTEVKGPEAVASYLRDLPFEGPDDHPHGRAGCLGDGSRGHRGVHHGGDAGRWTGR